MHCLSHLSYLELQTWEDLFRDLLSRGEDLVAKTQALCERLYEALIRAHHRLGQKADEVSQRLRRRIFETMSALRELRYQQAEVCLFIRSFVSSISDPSVVEYLKGPKKYVLTFSLVAGKDEREATGGYR